MNDPVPPLVRFGDEGLAPVVVQDALTGDVLMLAYMNAEALRLTRATGRAHYWSRSRNTLWRKGETSGNEQVVDEIRVNCERNSLLLLVRQAGAVCHDGYPTCYYRKIAPDESLSIVRERVFDPADVYSAQSLQPVGETNAELDPLAEATRRQFDAYAYLRDHDLTAKSDTSRRLRQPVGNLRARIADELSELAGVLDGEHWHGDQEDDLRLEASQVIYWVLLQALREEVTWARLRPDRALATTEGQLPAATVALLLRAEADRWIAEQPADTDLAATAHATLALVGQACASGGLDPLVAVESDIHELRSRPYLAPFFAREIG